MLKMQPPNKDKSQGKLKRFFQHRVSFAPCETAGDHSKSLLSWCPFVSKLFPKDSRHCLASKAQLILHDRWARTHAHEPRLCQALCRLHGMWFQSLVWLVRLLSPLRWAWVRQKGLFQLVGLGEGSWSLPGQVTKTVSCPTNNRWPTNILPPAA